jgi:ferredoxin
MKNNGEYAFAYKQPENDDEEIQCENALNICPVGAIGKEG